MAIQKRCREERNALWEESKRFEYPHQTYGDLSRKLWNLKNNLLDRYQTGATEQA
nr:hypothetical protein [uncultured Stomatobaculum sp.]